ncbi:MAG: hypothetical protein IKB94_06545, partial [Clostridia bacterium]|nr:hypothetical protein [Clostridia bacterium]
RLRLTEGTPVPSVQIAPRFNGAAAPLLQIFFRVTKKILKNLQKTIDKRIYMGYTVVKLMIMIIINNKSYNKKQSERR